MKNNRTDLDKAVLQSIIIFFSLEYKGFPMRILKTVLLCAGVLLLFLPCMIRGVEYPSRPDDRAFISDEADLLIPAAEEDIRKDLDALLNDKAIPVIVVTIPSLAVYQAEGIDIATYERMLFDEWGIGHKQIQVRGKGMGRKASINWNKGILLLVSVGDRKARIELGADWGHAQDSRCEDIMQSHIIPFFKKGQYEQGIRSGVKALEQMARGEKISAPPRPAWHYVLTAAAIFLFVFTIVSLIRRGASGWAWIFWGIVFSIIGVILYQVLTSRGGSSGGFGGGSFGGGFSGGGGATGSW